LRHLIEHAQERGDVTFARCSDVATAAQQDPDLTVRNPAPPAAPADTFPAE
jgi:peptidoglycan-N-acetylglucosamine deacetylase